MNVRRPPVVPPPPATAAARPAANRAPVPGALPTALARDLDGAFEALVQAEQGLVYGLALRSTGDPGAAEELAQDAFVRAYRALAGYPPERIRELELRPWLVRITLNLCRTRARRLQRRPAGGPLDDAAERPAAAAEGPEPTALRREAEAAWEARLAALPVAWRRAVELRHVHGLSYVEAAAALDRPVNTVKTHVHRGLARLRAAYEQETRP